MSRAAAFAIGLIPVAALGVLAMRRRVGSAWWWMAAGFGVSFVADLLTLVMPHPLVSQVYPVSQAALFLLVLLPRSQAIAVIGALFAAAAGSMAARQGMGLDFPLHAVAWGSVAGAAWLVLMPGLLRTALGVCFPVLILAWGAFVLWPGWTAWGAMQGVRVALAIAWTLAAIEAHVHQEKIT